MSYGISADPWSLADGTGVSTQSVTKSGLNASEAEATDSCGDVIATTLYDTTDGNTQSVTYKVASTDSGTAAIPPLGTVVAGYVITGVNVSTSNGDYGTVEVSGQKTSTADSAIAKYAHGLTFANAAGKCAQGNGITPDASSRLVSSSASASVDIARAQDSTGEELALDVFKGRVEVSAELIGVTGAAGGTADTGYTIVTGAGVNETNTDYATGSITAFKNITAT